MMLLRSPSTVKEIREWLKGLQAEGCDRVIDLTTDDDGKPIKKPSKLIGKDMP